MKDKEYKIRGKYLVSFEKCVREGDVRLINGKLHYAKEAEEINLYLAPIEVVWDLLNKDENLISSRLKKSDEIEKAKKLLKDNGYKIDT